MKILFFFVFLLSPWLAIQAQPKDLPDFEAFFSATIVSDVTVSSKWYKEKLGFEIVKENVVDAIGLKQVNLRRGNVLVELIELSASVAPKKVIPDYNSKTKVQGLFKFGLIVPDFDNWIDYLSNSGVDFKGNVVFDSISQRRTVIIKDPDGNRIQLFEK